MKTIDIKTYMASLSTEEPSKLLGINASSNPCTATPSTILKSANNVAGYITNYANSCYGDKWYRIASGQTIAEVNSAILNIAHRFNHAPHEANLFFLALGGTGTKRAVRLDQDGSSSFVKKIRFLYNGANAIPYVDVMFNFGAENRNTIILSYSCNINFIFQQLVEVSDTPDEGYSVKEFTFE